jgi:hypothetical protein
LLSAAISLSLALHAPDGNLGLIIGGSGEDLGLLGGDCSVSADKSGEHSSEGLNTKGQRGHIEQKDILDLTSEDGSLDGSANSDGLIGVLTLVRALSEELGDIVLKTLGILVIPPTRRSSSTLSLVRPESLRQDSKGFIDLVIKLSTSCLSLFLCC